MGTRRSWGRQGRPARVFPSSEAALLSAALVDQRVGAVVALVPGNVVLCSWPPGQPAWTLAGEPLSYLSFFGPTAPRAEAYIPVEDIPAPPFLVGAGMDRVWPSAAMADAISQRRQRHGIHRGVVLHYPHGGHDLALLGPADLPGPTPSSRGQGTRVIITQIDPLGERQAREPERQPANSGHRADAWHHLLSFLASLSGPSAA